MAEIKTIVLVLRSGGDFSFRDVELIARHINGKWKALTRPRILCLWDGASTEYNLGNIEIIPLPKDHIGTWSRIHLYSPAMEKYRPYLYIDLDTAVIGSLENIFALVKDETQFITLEDFWQKGKLATGLVWFPKGSDKVNRVWKNFGGAKGKRMDNFLRQYIEADTYWQRITNTIHDFKPRTRVVMSTLPDNTDIVCFHGKPRIYNAQDIPWIKSYVNQRFKPPQLPVTVIIPYKVDRGWLQHAVDSVPKNVQVILSQGEGNWPANFNKALPDAKGKYIRWLHEDDMLTPNSIEDAVYAIEEQGADFIHGNTYEFRDDIARTKPWIPRLQYPTLADMLVRNYIHSTTLLYRREVFETLGGLDETLNTAEEYEYHLRCLKAGLKLGYCDSFLAYYRRHPLQKVRVVPRTSRSQEREQVKTEYKC